MLEETDTEIWVEEFLTDLLCHMGLDMAVEELHLDDDGALRVQIGGPDGSRAIGWEGQVLDAMQQVTIAAAAHTGVGHRRILLDVNGYRERREIKLKEEAARIAAEALRTGQIHEFAPMPARERRVIHLIVAGMEGVKSESLGEGDERYVRVVPL